MEIKLYADGSVELYRQLAKEVLRLIAAGKLSEGDKLPSVRQLATELKVSPNTVSKAYQLLHDQGIILVEPKRLATVKRHLPYDERIANIKGELAEIILNAQAALISKGEFTLLVEAVLSNWEEKQ